jgi:hypothetical protein
MTLPRALVAASIALASLNAPKVQAAQLQTDVDINLPSIIVLYCFDFIDVNVDATNFLTAVGANGTTGNDALFTNNPAAVSATGTPDLLTANPVTLNVESAGIGTTADLRLNGACAFRAIGSDVDVSIATDETTLETASGNSSIEVTGAEVGDAGSAPAGATAFAGSYTVPAADLGFGNVRFIDVQLALDFADALESGDYSSATDGTFTVTAVAN